MTPAQPVSSVQDPPISNAAETHKFIPTLNQVRHVIRILLHKLPVELILPILHIAEYHPRCQSTLHDIRPITKAKSVILRYDLAHDIIARETAAQGNAVEWPDIRVDEIMLKIESKDQGWSHDVQWHGTYAHSWTWFELAVFDDIKKVSTRPVFTSELYRNRHAHGQFETYEIIFGPSSRPQITVPDGAIRDERQEQLSGFWPALERARKPRIEVLGCAEFPGWINNIRLVDFYAKYSERRNNS
jgi:hypothetical protein